MTIPAFKKLSANEPRIGEHSAPQPLSGITRVDETFAVNGLGRGAYAREEKTEKKTEKAYDRH